MSMINIKRVSSSSKPLKQKPKKIRSVLSIHPDLSGKKRER